MYLEPFLITVSLMNHGFFMSLYIICFLPDKLGLGLLIYKTHPRLKRMCRGVQPMSKECFGNFNIRKWLVPCRSLISAHKEPDVIFLFLFRSVFSTSSSTFSVSLLHPPPWWRLDMRLGHWETTIFCTNFKHMWDH